MKRALLFSLACLLGAQPAMAQPATADKGDAKSLMASGLKLYAAKDYLGALAVFRTAHDRFPSGKILLNIGTTLLKLERKAEAANAYQGYLYDPEGDPAKRDEVTKVLAKLDRELGVLEIEVTPSDAEVKIGAGEWTPAAELKRYRVAKGSVTVRARRATYLPAEQTLKLDAGERQTLALALELEPKVTTPAVVVFGDGVRSTVTPERPSRFGGLVIAHIDPVNQGGAVLLGATFEVTTRLQAQAAAILGPAYGGYGGASFALLTGRLRPIVSAGIPVFVSSGARFGLRAAGGVQFALTRRITLVAELGVEHVLNAEASVTPTLFIPAVGAIGRL